MQGFYIIIENIGMLSVLILIGYIAVKARYLQDPEAIKNVISKILLRLLLPLLFITSLTQRDLTGGMVQNALIVALVTALLIPSMLLLALAVGKMLKMPYCTLVVHCFLSAFGNIVFLGYPLLTALYGSEGLFYAAVYSLVNDCVFYTFGIYMLSKCKDGERRHLALKRLLSPLTISFVIAVMMMALGIKLPRFIFTPFNMLAQCTVPLAMLFIGIVLAEVKPSRVFLPWTKFLGIALKQFIVPVLAVLLLKPFGIAPVVVGVLVMQAAMPAQTMISVLANEYGADQQYSAEGIFLSMIISVFSLPFIYRIIELVIPS